MTSLFNVIAHEDANDQSKLRQAMALATQRVEDRFGAFVRQGSVDDQAARYSLVEDDINAVVIAACMQAGHNDATGIYQVIARNFVTGDATPLLRTASVRHEARKPKMCPYHSEVTDISLASGNPQDGFNAMAQHAWTPQHCQGEGYKGDRCKFKPAMTTQAFWDEKAEKAQLRRDEREQQQALEPVVNELPEVETPEAEFVDGLAETDGFDGAEVEHSEPSAIGEGVPMSMAAKTADSTTGLAGPIPKMDKRKWTPKTVPHDIPGLDDADGRWPTKRKDVVEPITQKPDSPDNKGELKEIGEATTEHQDVTKGTNGPSTSGQGGSFGGGDRSAVSHIEGRLLSPEAVKTALSRFK